MARKELASVSLIRPVAGAAGLAAGRVRKKGSIGATAEEAIPVVNHVMASPRVFRMGASIEGTDELATVGVAENRPCADGSRDIRMGAREIAFVTTARPPPTVIEKSLVWHHARGKAISAVVPEKSKNLGSRK